VDVKQENYNISFFKPTTELSKKNAKISIVLLFIWAVAVFGFHILLKVIEKPTPEPAYLSFENVWDNVKIDNASITENQNFIKSTLSVIGKLSIKDEDKEVLNHAVTYSIFNIADEDKSILLKEKMNAFHSLKDVNISDKEYIRYKVELTELAASIINVEPYSIEAKLLPFAVKSVENSGLDKDKIPLIMSKYLIHNQSFLTDAKFLGFPFHYFYTAVFLLILFVGLCWFFCFKTDRIYKKLGIEERV